MSHKENESLTQNVLPAQKTTLNQKTIEGRDNNSIYENLGS